MQSLVVRLHECEEFAVRGRDFAAAAEAQSATTRITSGIAHVKALKDNENAAVAARDYAVAAQNKDEADSALAGLAADISGIQEQFSLRFASLPVAKPAPIAQPVPPIAMGAPVQGMHEPLIGVQPTPVIAPQYRPMQPQTLVMQSPYNNIPPGVPAGGCYRMENYCGPITWIIGCFVCCCVCCCPCDQREVYVTPNGQKYSRNGAPVDDCC